MKNTEITVQIFENIDIVKQKMIQFGFEEFEEFSGEDTYFSVLNREQVLKSDNKKVDMLLFKNKILDENNNVVSEEKVSTNIDNLDNCKKMLKLAGLTNWATLKQKNAFFKNGEIVVIVGTVENLDGTFMEIEEYPSIKDKSEKEKFEILKDLSKSFGFETGDDYSVKKVYMLYKNFLNN